MTEANSYGVYRYAFFMQRVGKGLAEAVKLCAFDAGFLRNRLQLTQEVPVRFAFAVWENQVMRLGIALSHSLFDFPNQLCRNRNESIFGGFLLALALGTEMAPRLRLYMKRAFLPVEVCVFRVLHVCVPNPGVQEQTVEQFLLVVHGSKHRFEFLLRVRLRWFLSVVKFRQNLAGNKNVPCPQERVQGFEDVVNRAVVQVAVMLSQKLHVPQKLGAIDLVYVPQVVLDGEVEEKSEAVVVRS